MSDTPVPTDRAVALGPLPLEEFGRHFFPKAPAGPLVRGLHRLLTAIPSEQAPLAERLAWLERLGTWLRPRLELLPSLGGAKDAARTGRLRVLVQVLRQTPEWRQRVAALVRSVLGETSGFTLLCETGLPAQPGFLGEAADRLSKRFLPAPPDDQDLAQLVERVFPEAEDADWLEQIPPELTSELATLLAEGRDPFARLRGEMADAVAVIATRIAALGLADDVRDRSPSTHVRESPFLNLPRACDRVLAAEAGEAREAARAGAHRVVGDCRRTVKAVLAKLEEAGVSVDLVYRLELITRNLDRLVELLELACPPPAGAGSRHGAHLLAELVRGRAGDKTIVGLVRSNARQLARKIIERAGHTGEHYITSTRAEWHRMVSSAGGGGVLTAGTAALKFLVGWAKLPFFFDLLFSTANYAGSFVLMQLVGFTLATKQPSMTAAALAGSLKAAGKKELDPLVEMIARITRSQLAAAIGNLGMVIPAALTVDFLVRQATGAPFLDPKTAEYVVHSLHPLHSLVVLWAALTGVLLWASSVFAGWMENWAVYRRLPEAIAKHRALTRIVGPRFAERISHWFLHNVSGLAGSVSLGTLLAGVPVLGKFFGVPLSAAHVTLSTGALVFAGSAIGPYRLWETGVAGAAIGILLIGTLNFGVSFALALSVAFRAREVDNADRVRLVRAVLDRFRKTPLDFVRPPREEPPPLPAAAVLSPEEPAAPVDLVAPEPIPVPVPVPERRE